MMATEGHSVQDAVRVLGCRGGVTGCGLDSDPGPDVAHIRQGGQPLCRGWVERGQSVDAGAGQIMMRFGLDVGDPQRGVVGAARNWRLPAKCLALPEYHSSLPLPLALVTRSQSLRMPSRIT